MCVYREYKTARCNKGFEIDHPVINLLEELQELFDRWISSLGFGCSLLISVNGANVLYAIKDKGYMHIEYLYYGWHTLYGCLSRTSCLFKVTLKMGKRCCI